MWDWHALCAAESGSVIEVMKGPSCSMWVLYSVCICTFNKSESDVSVNEEAVDVDLLKKPHCFVVAGAAGLILEHNRLHHLSFRLETHAMPCPLT